MSVSVQVSESAVPIGAAGTSQQVRNLIATVLINGVATPVMMQVISMSDQNGNLLDMGITRRQDIELQILADLRREVMIQNELMTQLLSVLAPNTPTIDLNKEYRSDPSYDYLGI